MVRNQTPAVAERELEDRLDQDTVVAHRYRVVRFAGNRGFGQVYEAEDTATDHAVSLMRLDREFSRADVRDRFFATRGNARIDHPGAVDLTDYGEDLDGRLFLVMPWIAQAEALDELLAREQPIGWARARNIAEQVARALAAAHSRGILHGGLDPSRVLIDSQGNPHVLDFGLAPALESATKAGAGKATPITNTRVLASKPAYMPPELVRGEPPNERSDVYALGLMLWELVAGSPPFTGNPVDTLHRQVHDPLPELVRGDAPVEVEALLHLALAKDPDERFTSVEEMLETLRPLPGPSATPKLLPRTPTVPLAEPSAAKPSVAPPAPPPAALPTALPEPPASDAAARAPVVAPVAAIASAPIVSKPATGSQPALALPRKRRFGLLERAIGGFLLFDLVLLGVWMVTSGKPSEDAAEPVAAVEPLEPRAPEAEARAAEAPAAASSHPTEPAIAVADRRDDAPTDAAPESDALGLDPTTSTEPLPKALSAADFRRTMVDARNDLVKRCLGDQRMRRTFKISIAVAPTGKVEWATVLDAPGQTALGKCIAKQTRQIVAFPPSLEGGSDVYTLRLR